MRNASGVYEIFNTADGKRYIGSATKFNGRWRKHLSDLRHNKHANPKLQNAWNKHGESSFLFRVLLLCSKENRLLYEQLIMAALKPEYNIALIAGAPMEGRKHTPEALKKMSRSHMGNKHSLGFRPSIETLAILSAMRRGKKHPPESVARAAESNRGKKRTDESKLKMSRSQRKRRDKEIEQLTKETK